jgi:NADP-dependent 3-hydroxy acid dehydrogenase YdfG
MNIVKEGIVMREFEGKVALITGAGNGFGKEFAREAHKRGMKLLLADIDENSLKKTMDEIIAQGGTASACIADVSSEDDVERMVRDAMKAFGRIDLLINNAGVTVGGYVTDLPTRDWEWIIGVNCMSQVYAMKRVIPIMQAQGTACHIVNVASLAALVTGGGAPAYFATKHFDIALSESIYYDLLASGASIGMSVFCPCYVQTNLHRCERSRPVRFQKPDDPYYSSDIYRFIQSETERLITTGTTPALIGPCVFQAIEKGKFYIEPYKKGKLLIRHRMRNILKGRNPNPLVIAATDAIAAGKVTFRQLVDFLIYY